jgi:hypothetical protein
VLYLEVFWEDVCAKPTCTPTCCCVLPVESLKFGSLLLLNKAVTLSAMASNTGGALVKGETDGEGEKGEGDEEGEGEGDEESEGRGR